MMAPLPPIPWHCQEPWHRQIIIPVPGANDAKSADNSFVWHFSPSTSASKIRTPRLQNPLASTFERWGDKRGKGKGENEGRGERFKKGKGENRKGGRRKTGECLTKGKWENRRRWEKLTKGKKIGKEGGKQEKGKFNEREVG